MLPLRASRQRSRDLLTAIVGGVAILVSVAGLAALAYQAVLLLS